jgi:hypothetical protein
MNARISYNDQYLRREGAGGVHKYAEKDLDQ